MSFNMKMKSTDYLIAEISDKLINLMSATFPGRPYTCYVTRWDDDTFKVIVSSTLFDLPQHEAIRQPEYKKYVKEYKYYADEITYTEREEIKTGNPNMPLVQENK